MAWSRVVAMGGEEEEREIVMLIADGIGDHWDEVGSGIYDVLVS